MMRETYSDMLESDAYELYFMFSTDFKTGKVWYEEAEGLKDSVVCTYLLRTLKEDKVNFYTWQLVKDHVVQSR
jgi:hypothetical protein